MPERNAQNENTHTLKLVNQFSNLICHTKQRNEMLRCYNQARIIRKEIRGHNLKSLSAQLEVFVSTTSSLCLPSIKNLHLSYNAHKRTLNISESPIFLPCSDNLELFFSNTVGLCRLML